MGIAKTLDTVLRRRDNSVRPRFRADQLDFPHRIIEDKPQEDAIPERLIAERAAAKSRPVPNDDRQAENSRVLLNHFSSNPEFWESILLELEDNRQLVLRNSPRPARKSRLKSATELLDASTVDALEVYLRALTDEAEARIDSEDSDLFQIAALGLSFLAHQIRLPEMDYFVFRKIWLLLWPVLNDFGLLEEVPQALRIAIQKMVTQSF